MHGRRLSKPDYRMAAQQFVAVSVHPAFPRREQAAAGDSGHPGGGPGRVHLLCQQQARNEEEQHPPNARGR